MSPSVFLSFWPDVCPVWRIRFVKKSGRFALLYKDTMHFMI